MDQLFDGNRIQLKSQFHHSVGFLQIKTGIYWSYTNIKNKDQQKYKVYEYKELASHYNNQVREYDSYGHDVLFGMSFEFVKTDEKLLDIGIGTGLASLPFSQVGLKVYGLDVSQEMLNACQSKSFTQALPRPVQLCATRWAKKSNLAANIL